nr:MAG TPA: hypothetical protein [Caudoviricetes sp.]
MYENWLKNGNFFEKVVDFWLHIKYNKRVTKKKRKWRW